VTPSAANILGLSGAPSTGKSTLARALAQALNAQGIPCALLGEPARELARRGVRIDDAMGLGDYDAFLGAYISRDEACPGLGVADRTPADHYSYLVANQPLPPEFMRRHHAAALSALERYRVVLYLPPELPLVDDNFRILRPDYRAVLDTAIQALLAESSVPVVTLQGPRPLRLAHALAAVRRYWPELAQTADADSG
jgi:nicotinamide riboside kinase